MVSKNVCDLIKIEFAIKQLNKIDESKTSGSEHNSFYELIDMKEDTIKKLSYKLNKIKRNEKDITLDIKNILEYYKNGYINIQTAIDKIINL